MSDIQFYAFDRWGNQKGIIANWIECVHTDEINGEDSITLDVPSHDLVKGDRLVWQDKQGVWHEHTVNGIEDNHTSEGVTSEIYAENSISELFVCWNDDLRNQDTTATVALEKALSTSRWQMGTVSISNTASCNFYHQSARQSVADIIETWGGELRTDISVSGAHVSARKVSIVAHRGSEKASKRFEYDKDIQTLSREVSEDDIYTAVYGFGKGIENTDDDGNATGGYTRKITCGLIEDNNAKEKYGIPAADGSKAHAIGSVEFSDCEDVDELKTLTTEYLATVCKPQVSYTIAVVNLADSGLTWEDCSVGDEVQIYDKVLDERLQGRVLGIKRFLQNEDASVITVGNMRKRITDSISDALNGYKKLNDRSSEWDSVADTATPYIEAIITKLNKMFNEAGNSYCYTSLEMGTIWASVPLDENGKPTTTPATALQINNQGFRIASTTNADGTFKWRTFGTGSGFSADEINAGTINAALIKAGILQSVSGGNWWNLEDGTMNFEKGTIRNTSGSTVLDLTNNTFTTSDIDIQKGARIGDFRLVYNTAFEETYLTSGPDWYLTYSGASTNDETSRDCSDGVILAGNRVGSVENNGDYALIRSNGNPTLDLKSKKNDHTFLLQAGSEVEYKASDSDTSTSKGIGARVWSSKPVYMNTGDWYVGTQYYSGLSYLRKAINNTSSGVASIEGISLDGTKLQLQYKNTSREHIKGLLVSESKDSEAKTVEVDLGSKFKTNISTSTGTFLTGSLSGTTLTLNTASAVTKVTTS